MHFNFVKGPKGDRVRFFQSSIPYLNNTSATVYKSGRARKWNSEEPQTLREHILTFSHGHYGIYFTIFNHELRRDERVNFSENNNPWLLLVVPSNPLQFFMPEFFISKANQMIQNDISELKLVSHEHLSTLSLFSPKKLFTLSLRKFSTTARNLDETQQKFGEQQPKIEEIVEEQTEDAEEPFESGFRKSQVNRIVSVFASHSDPQELNVIYPIYQSLKRNELALPTIYEYNIVLKSIAMRALDSDASIESVESRLTCLLTVYQDVLSACTKNGRCKPNNETFNIILHEIFKGAVTTIDLGSSLKIANDTYQAAFVKSEEFCQVGINLFMSVKDQSELDLGLILPNLITAVNVHPTLLHKDLVARLINLKNIGCASGMYYIGLINLSRYLQNLGLRLSPEDVYNYVSSVFELYKENVPSHAELGEFEYQIYSALVKALIHNGNLNMATKFLDDVLVDFKNGIGSEKLAAQKQNVSNLISDYLQAVMGSGSAEDLNRAYNLLGKFREVNYIPDVSVQVYNDMINRFIGQFTLHEYEKSNGNDGVTSQQQHIYSRIWELYEKAAIRKDFQAGPITNPRSQSFGLEVNCRDFLLSLSLDLNDHEKITKLLKEILLKGHVISDWNVSKKLCLYLYNGVAAYNNEYYCNLLWSVIELQGSHHHGNSKELNKFLSEHVNFLMYETPGNVERLLDSQVVFQAFSLFSLKEDNIYGLMSITNYLMYHMQQPSFTTVFKLMQLQLYLIGEFEDTENHYLQLSPELVQFKTMLSQLFAQLYTMYPNMRVTEEIDIAAQKLGLDIAETNLLSLSSADFVKDLSPLFGVNYSVAVSSFLENFKLGYKFTTLTWENVICEDFVLDVLETNSHIKIVDFLDRISASGSDSARLFASLVSLNNEKINVETLKYVLAKDTQVLGLTRFLTALADFASISGNKYFLKLVTDNMALMLSRNQSKGWLTTLLDKLTTSGQLDTVDTILSTNESLVLGLDVTQSEDEDFLKVVLMAYLNLGKSDKINEVLGHYFQGQEGNRLLLKSDKLLECLLNHYIATGAYNEVLTNFAVLQNRSAELEQLIQFTRFMSQLTGSPKTPIPENLSNANSVGLAILSEKNPMQMKDLFEENKEMIRNKEQFFDFMVMCLAKASSLSGGMFASRINSKFEAIIKLCKAMKLSEISVASLVNIIKLLALTRSERLLNVLYNKFVHGDHLLPYVNLYFLHVDVSNERDANLLLNALQNALRQVDDQLNLAS